MRRLAIQRRVRSILVEPEGIAAKLPAERLAAKWHDDDPRAFVFEAQNEPFHQGDAAVLTNGAEAGSDPLAITPVLERVAPELRAFVADNIFWRCACVDNGVFEEGLDTQRCGIVFEYRKAHHASGVVVNDLSLLNIRSRSQFRPLMRTS